VGVSNAAVVALAVGGGGVPVAASINVTTGTGVTASLGATVVARPRLPAGWQASAASAKSSTAQESARIGPRTTCEDRVGIWQVTLSQMSRVEFTPN
jgi:hypothetical protein